MTLHRHSPLIIIGSGPAGYSAAIYGARALLKPILISGLQQGGQLSTVLEIENYPGFEKTIEGPFLMDQMAKQAQKFGTEIIHDTIINVDFSQRPFKLIGDSGTIYESQAVIIATGAKAKWLEIPSEKHYKGKGVSACATCDGFFFRNKNVAIVGGGNVAVEDAIYLSHIAQKVYLIHRGDKLKAEPIMQKRLEACENVQILWNHIVKEILGTKDENTGIEYVTGISIEDLITKQISQLSVEGLFVAIGHQPATEIFQSFLTLHDKGYILTKPDSTQTNIEGVFAAGDVADNKFRQAIVAAGRGCMAALEAQAFLEKHNVG